MTHLDPHVRTRMKAYISTEAFAAINRHAACDYLDAALTDLCRDLGLSPWDVLHRPRLHARIAAQDALMAQVRADAMRVQGKRPRGRDGRFVGRAS